VGEVTALIARAHLGDQAANAELFTTVYAELKRVAERQVRRIHETPMHTTTLVHEAYFRLAKQEALVMRDRAHFFAVAGRAMRQLLLDEVRARHTTKRSEDKGVPLDLLSIDALSADALLTESDTQVFALEQALQQLTAMDAALGQLVELRFYAGLDLAEIAQITERSERSLKRDWRKARAFLHAVLGRDDPAHTASEKTGTEQSQS
jgi:RNA polymerase sigma factor (TIGR02999 family)